VFDFSAVGLQGYGPTNEGNFEPAVDTLAILTEKFQGLRSNSPQTAFAVLRQDNRAKMVLQDRRASQYRSMATAVKVRTMVL
jgi:hypothetical protein